MRGYPIGIVLMWETYNNIQYRRFEKDYREYNKPTFNDNGQNKKLKIVLDGQQRLQSLYIALYGQFKDKCLYFDILSGRINDDFKEESYYFYFATTEEAKEWNDEASDYAKTPAEQRTEDLEYYVRVSQIFEMGTTEKLRFRNDLARILQVSEPDQLRLEVNLSKLDEVLVKDQNILKSSVIDENRPSNSKERKSESDVLEIFVRINRQGTPLSRSDLIFSMLKLNWREAAINLPDFVDSINRGNSFELDIDFVIRSLFAVCNLGTKFNIDLLRQPQNMKSIKENFEKCCNAIRSAVDIIQKDCWCSNSKALGGYHSLVPFVYYLFHAPNHQVPNSELERFRKTLYLFGLTSPFSRYADSRLVKLIREVLKPLLEKGNYRFPFEGAVWWTKYWEGISAFGEEMVQRNPKLALSLVQGHTGAKTHFQANSPEMDHIFPRAVLRQKGFNEAEINHFSNFWLLSKNKNQNKSSKHPKKYFEDVNDVEMKRAFIDRSMLDYRQYRSFLKKRSSLLLENIKTKIGFTDEDFPQNSQSS